LSEILTKASINCTTTHANTISEYSPEIKRDAARHQRIAVVVQQVFRQHFHIEVIYIAPIGGLGGTGAASIRKSRHLNVMSHGWNGMTTEKQTREKDGGKGER